MSAQTVNNNVISYTLFKPPVQNVCKDTYNINPINTVAEALINKAKVDPFKLLTVKPQAQSQVPVINVEVNACKIAPNTNNIARKYVVKRTLETTGNKNLQYTIVGEEFINKTECESGVKGKAFSTDTSSLPQEMLFFPNAADPTLNCTPVTNNAYAVSTSGGITTISDSPAQIMASCIKSCANKTAEENCFYKDSGQENTPAHLQSTLPPYNTSNLPACGTNTTGPGGLNNTGSAGTNTTGSHGSAANPYASIYQS
eukprot:Pgem_evm1s17961